MKMNVLHETNDKMKCVASVTKLLKLALSQELAVSLFAVPVGSFFYDIQLTYPRM